jgi:uroporphyrin-III C-methyltransferase
MENEMTRLEMVRALVGEVAELAPGEVWLAGAGPGDPALLTVQLLAGLAQADAVVHDALIDPRVLAMARPEALLVPAGKRGGRPSADQADIIARLIALAGAGHRVLRLKGGDTYVFGRGAEEALALAAAGISFRIVPGLTAGLAGPALAGIPTTMRGVNQAVILATGHPAGPAVPGDAPEPDWAALARLGQTIVIYMASRTIGRIAAAMIAGGADPATPAAAIAAASTARARVAVTTLSGIAEAVAAMPGADPKIVVIGAVVAVRAELLALADQVRK